MRSRDESLLARIRASKDTCAVAARELFFDHFQRMEAVIQRRLCRYSMAYDAGSEHYNAVFTHVYERVYSADTLPKAVAEFDPERGKLDSWVLNRVGYVVQDWLKVHRDEAVRQFESEDIEQEAVVEAGPAESEESGGPESAVLDRALAAMTPPQRASTALRLLPTRPLSEGDLAAVVEVSGGEPAVLRKELEQLSAGGEKQDLGVREQEILGQLSFWHAKLHHQQRLYERYRRQLSDLGESESTLAELEAGEPNRTQESILEKYRRLPPATGKPQQRRSLTRRFEYTCHEIGRCRRRLEQLSGEYSGAASVALLEYAEIARILNSTVPRVTSYLNRARNSILAEENRRKEEG